MVLCPASRQRGYIDHCSTMGTETVPRRERQHPLNCRLIQLQPHYSPSPAILIHLLAYKLGNLMKSIPLKIKSNQSLHEHILQLPSKSRYRTDSTLPDDR